ncbi:V/A-type H+-transporting ATPase subunit I [Aequitasia blattaphilus]|uniref:V-type ATP synthase subunit I n=1 Tax=Aequitasia blattaphilus TaxID=2949332 RepID=A0ABT1E937_9FIRM|nr:V-type ATP synthase subunit I [Aequitasia blattaphilus]MCP1101032.1 V-type ATP synthase subunit I [Aequitasia blattaphilus]MCR8613672.1 V-type ATP synthase subunit I [Aequitasia blattaphilus]
MAKLQMQRVSICALKRDRKAVLEKMQKLGVMEVSSIEDEELERLDTQTARQSFDKKTNGIESALTILQTYAPAKTSMFDGLKGKDLIESDEFNPVIEDREEYLSASKKLISLEKEISEKKANISKTENQVEAIQPWLKLDIPMDYKGTQHTRTLIGTMAPLTTLEMVYTFIKEYDDSLDAVEVEIINQDKDATYLCVVCLREEADKVEEALRLNGFARPANPISQIPLAYEEELKADIRSYEKEIEDRISQVKEFESKRKGLKFVSDYYRMRKEKYEVLGTLPQSERTFFISGYIPKREVPKIQKAIGDVYTCIIDIDELGEEEEAPVLLDNSTFPSSVEGVVSSYGLPGKDDVDPSMVTSIFYVIFFGLMLSDAAYGLVVFLACFIVLKKFPRMGIEMRKSIRLFMYCGVSTTVWGVLFGGYFGDLISVVSKVFFNKEIIIKPLWFAPLDNPMKLLIFSMLFGVIHLFVGLGVKGYLCIKNKDIVGFVSDVVFWYMMLIGLILMLLPSQIFVSMSQMNIVFPPAINTLAKGLAIAGALGIFLMSGRSSKNFGLRLALGAYDLYNITGWVSDVLSYSRLLALGLATGVIASVINQMGTMAGKSVLGVIIFIFAFVVGHTFNLGINMLGAYVHTCRLQYVEFFGKFYEGGGRAFRPFTTNTNYVDLKED